MIIRRASKRSHRFSPGPELLGLSLNLAAMPPAPSWAGDRPHIRAGVRGVIWDPSLLCIYISAPTSTVPVQLYCTPEQAEELRNALTFALDHLEYEE